MQSKMAEIARSKKWVKMLQEESWQRYYPGDKVGDVALEWTNILKHIFTYFSLLQFSSPEGSTKEFHLLFEVQPGQSFSTSQKC